LALMVLLGWVAAQTCPCVEQISRDCEVLEEIIPSFCSSSSVRCTRCICVTEDQATTTCEVDTGDALVFTDAARERCGVQTFSYAVCPGTRNSGWVLAATQQSCTAACNAAVGSCNESRMQTLNALGATDAAAFKVPFAAAGVTCNSVFGQANSFGLAPFAGTVNCVYTTEDTSSCDTSVGSTLVRRLCCCGLDSDCPL